MLNEFFQYPEVGTDGPVRIYPGKLEGEVTVGGSKNSAPKLLAATLLTDGETVIGNVPDTAEVRAMMLSLVELKCAVIYDARECSITVDTSSAAPADISEFASSSRIGLTLIPPLLYRFGSIHIPYPTGDAIGMRQIDIHLDGLRAFGATVEESGRHITISSPTGLTGAEFTLRNQSVMATENMLMLAAFAKGDSVIANCADIPEITRLVEFLRLTGVQIEQFRDEKQRIGYRLQGGTGFRCVRKIESASDHNAAVTWAVAGILAGTGSGIHIKNINAEDLQPFLRVLTDMGISFISQQDTGFVFRRADIIRAASAPIVSDRQTGVIGNSEYFSVYSDWQAMMSLLSLFAQGETHIVETAFGNRLGHLKEVARSNAGSVRLFDASQMYPDLKFMFPTHQFPINGALITGLKAQNHVSIKGDDIRSSAFAILYGSLVRQGSTLCNTYHLRRGYHDFLSTAIRLGANIEY